jgi:hypothetical protein
MDKGFEGICLRIVSNNMNARVEDIFIVFLIQCFVYS